jgi:hypothetical protein
MSTSVGSLNRWLLASATDHRSSCRGNARKNQLESAHAIRCLSVQGQVKTVQT